MAVLDEQLKLICDEFGRSTGEWHDSSCLETLLCAAHEHGVLSDVEIYQILDDDRDVFLVSVEVGASTYVHSALTHWRDVRPNPHVVAEEAVRHVLEWLGRVAADVRTRFLDHVAQIVSTAVTPSTRRGAAG
jgi:hypothetical protein